MKTGRTLTELAQEIERQRETKRDFVAQTDAVHVHMSPKAGVEIDFKAGDELINVGINKVAHGQIAEHTKIPKLYYDRMLKDAPDLLATNVQKWFDKYPVPQMLRTLDGKARAFLSNSYRPLDNHDFAEATLPILLGRGLRIESCEITDTRLYIKAIDEKLYRDVPVGHKMGDGSHTIFDTCAPAVMLSNSEVGFGRLVVETGVYTRACTNLAMWPQGGSMKRTHLGARHKLVDSVESIDHLLSDATRRKTDEALWLQVKDVIAAAFDGEVFGQRLEKLSHAATQKIEGNVGAVIEMTADKFGFNIPEKDSILKRLIEGGSLTQYGLHSAITRAAQDVEDYDRATDLEHIGAKVLELPRTEWRALAEAA